MHKAKTELSRIVADVIAGREVVIARNGKPVVRLEPYRDQKLRVPGLMKGKIRYSDDFDQTLDDVVRLFEGGDSKPVDN